MSRAHCYECQRWDGSHSTGCTGKYVGGTPEEIKALVERAQANGVQVAPELVEPEPDPTAVDRENELRRALGESSKPDAELLFQVFSAARDGVNLTESVGVDFARFDAMYDEIRMRLDRIDEEVAG
jgi:hypothetical protein